MKWFYIDESITDGERRQGPYTIDEILDFVKQKKIKDETLVWHSGEENWKAWKDFAESKDFSKSELSSAGDSNNAEITEKRKMAEEEIQKALETLQKFEKRQMGLRRFAGFFTRAIAYIVDNLILGVAGGIFLFAMGALGFLDLETIQNAVATYIDDPYASEAFDKLLSIPDMATFFTIWSVVQTIYFIVFHAIFSATPGKMLMKIHVVTVGGERLNWSTSIARYLCSILTQFTMFIYGLGYLIVCIDPKRRALHDWIARTYVVSNKIVKVNDDSDESQKDSDAGQEK